jgi:CubicO group peptidase (beta-lactamase class C family)
MKKMTIFILLYLILFNGLTALANIENQNNNNYLNINQKNNDIYDVIIEKIMEHSHFPSISACIIKNDQIVWSKGYGLSNIGLNYEANENTIYGICSMTKTITGTALMQLYDQGLFDLDEDVNNYLPFNLRNPNFPNEPITFRMLLSHSSSLRSPISYWQIPFYHEGGPPFEGYPMPWLEEYLIPDGANYDPDIWDSTNGPGELSRYANINFNLIGYLVEIIANEPYYEYCDNNIFKPLEMYNTGFNLSIYNGEDLAIPYNWNSQNNDYDINNNEVHFHYTAGGLFSTVSDMSNYMIAHMNGGIYKNVRILEKSTVDEMHRIQSPNTGGILDYGLAWILEPRSIQIGSRIFYLPNKLYGGHGGAVTYGLRTSMYMKKTGDTAVIYFINSDSFMYPEGWNGFELIREILFLKAKSY